MLVNYNAANIYTLGKTGSKDTLLKLLPGPNTIDEKTWQEALKNKMFKVYVDEGLIEVLDEGADSFDNLSAYKAKKVISQLCDTVKLEDLASSKKKYVRDAAEARLKQINSMRKEGSPADSDEDKEVFR